MEKTPLSVYKSFNESSKLFSVARHGLSPSIKVWNGANVLYIASSRSNMQTSLVHKTELFFMVVYRIMYPCRVSVIERHGGDGIYGEGIGMLWMKNEGWIHSLVGSRRNAKQAMSYLATSNGTAPHTARVEGCTCEREWS